MKKFKSKPFVHLFNTFSIIVPLGLFVIIHSIDPSIFNYFLLILVLISIFGLVNGLCTQYIIDSESIVLRSLTKKIVLNFSDIQCVYQQAPGWIAKFSVVIIGNSKTITLTNLTKNYELALRMVIERSSAERKVEIDPKLIQKRD